MKKKAEIEKVKNREIEAQKFKGVYGRRDVNDVNYGNKLLGAQGCIAVKLKYDAASP